MLIGDMDISRLMVCVQKVGEEKVKDKEEVVGEAPPRPEADPSQPVISVIMERDLGTAIDPVCFAALKLAILEVEKVAA